MATGIYWPSFFFLLFASVACVFALGVVLAANIVRMAFYLVLSLTATAGLFFLAGADFVGAMQIMIYVGGTLVLLVFGVMLTSRAPFISMRTRSGEWILAAIVGSSLFALLLWAALSVDRWQGIDRARAEALTARPTATRIGMSFLGMPVDKLKRKQQEERDVTLPRLSQGVAGYLLAFEIVSVHLLVVLVGAAYLGAHATATGGHQVIFQGGGARGAATMMLPLASLLTEPVGVSHYLAVGAFLFVCGAVAMATKRNALGVLLGIELVLNGANLNFVAFGSEILRGDQATLGIEGHVIALFVIVLAAAEAAVALAIALNFYNNFGTIDVDRADDLQG